MDTRGGDREPRPATAGDEKNGKTTETLVVSPKLKILLREAPPDYLTLSLTPSSARAAAAYRRWKRPEPEEVPLADVNAPRDCLSLSLTPSDQPRRRGSRDVSGVGAATLQPLSSTSRYL
jgi:hypothetical protein